MKSNFVVVIYTMLCVIIICSCNKNDELILNVDKKTQSPFSNNGIDSVKSDLEKVGTNLAVKTGKLNNSEGVEVSVQLMDLISVSNQTALREVMDRSMFKVIGELKKYKGNVIGLANILGKNRVRPFDNEWNKIAGVYTYNFNAGDFDFSPSITDNFVIVEFPGKKIDDQNTARLTVYDSRTDHSESANSAHGFVVRPVLLSCNLEYKDRNVMDYNLIADYKQHEPLLKLSSVVKIDDFSISEVLLVDAESTISHKLSLKENNNIVTEIYTGNDAGMLELAPDANVYYQILDLKVIGKIDFKDLTFSAPELKNGEINEKDVVEKQADLFNQYSNLIAVDSRKNVKVADVKAYPKLYVDPLVLNTKKEHLSIKTSYGVGLGMIFNDGSIVDISTYASVAFMEINNINKKQTSFDNLTQLSQPKLTEN